jgi:hypothetical protein
MSAVLGVKYCYHYCFSIERNKNLEALCSWPLYAHLFWLGLHGEWWTMFIWFADITLVDKSVGLCLTIAYVVVYFLNCGIPIKVYKSKAIHEFFLQHCFSVQQRWWSQTRDAKFFHRDTYISLDSFFSRIPYTFFVCWTVPSSVSCSQVSRTNSLQKLNPIGPGKHVLRPELRQGSGYQNQTAVDNYQVNTHITPYRTNWWAVWWSY